MKKFRYLVEYIIIKLFFFIFKFLGLKKSSYISGKIFSLIGPFFRRKNTILNNIRKALPQASNKEITKIIYEMWNYYGKIFAEYSFMKYFRNNTQHIELEGLDILEDIKKKQEPVIFISGHFDNFELMAMEIEKSGINLAAIYRPLNNIFMSQIMENIREKYICKKQIKKGRSSIRSLINYFKEGYSIALMIDQRVSEGIKSNFFGHNAYTTTIPAQFVKKFNCQVVPIFIERKNEIKFKIKIYKPISYSQSDDVSKVTKNLNEWLEQMILKKPAQWIWSHDRWK
jgi:Kdo2-lipid IVA lauroyltransferase/acyltransferase